MTIARDSDIRQQSVSIDAAVAKLAGTPLDGYAPVFEQLSQQYGIDLNWILSYLQWENGFGAANSFSMLHNNPWDILCYPGQWGASGCNDPGNGYSYAVYPTLAIGIEAGYRLWKSYVDRGWVTWFSSLSVALCGNSSGCNDAWVDNVIATGAQNAARWPYAPPPPPPPPPGGTGGSGPAFFLGLLAIAGAGGLLLYYMRGG